MTERTYALTKIGNGDYLCPSNDGTRLWRFFRYEENGSLETGDGKTIVGDFWETASCPMPTQAEWARCQADDTIDHLAWDTHQTLMKTRKEAIAVMEERQP